MRNLNRSAKLAERQKKRHLLAEIFSKVRHPQETLDRASCTHARKWLAVTISFCFTGFPTKASDELPCDRSYSSDDFCFVVVL